MSEKLQISEQAYDLNLQVGYLLRLANQRHTSIFQKNTMDSLTPTQFSALIRIYEEGSVSQNHLGRLCGMDVATIKGVVQRLQGKKLVAFSADPTDKRRTLISLTEGGQKIINELLRIGAAITEETLAPLTKPEQTQLIRLLQKIT